MIIVLLLHMLKQLMLSIPGIRDHIDRIGSWNASQNIIFLQHFLRRLIPLQNLNMDQLAQYTETQMNMTTFRLAENFVPDLQVTANSHRREYITLFDSLLTVYHGVRSYYYQKGSCHWLGEDAIYSSIEKVCLFWISTGHMSRKISIGDWCPYHAKITVIIIQTFIF